MAVHSPDMIDIVCVYGSFGRIISFIVKLSLVVVFISKMMIFSLTEMVQKELYSKITLNKV